MPLRFAWCHGHELLNDGLLRESIEAGSSGLNRTHGEVRLGHSSTRWTAGSRVFPFSGWWAIANPMEVLCLGRILPSPQRDVRVPLSSGNGCVFALGII